MKNEVHKVQSYQFTASDRLFLDANFWLYFYGPTNSRDKRKLEFYSNAWRRMLEAGSQIFIDVLVTSEFMNTIARVKWGLMTNKKIKYKDFRNSNEYMAVAEEIADLTKRILDGCTLIESGFGSIDVMSIMRNFAKRQVDFNDQIIEVMCRQNDFTLVTDDGDFANHGLRVLTANRRLLRER